VTLAPWHEENWRLLAERRARGTLPHALLLCGPQGLGKREFAETLAASLLCQQPRADGTACGTCRACLLLAAGSHPDRVRIGLELRDDGKPRTEITVEQIRILSERLALTAQFGGFQIATIDPADQMNHAASNALLKTLEEPTPATVIALIADHPARLSATIRSRCQRVEFRVPAAAQAQAWLATHGADPKLAANALAAASGNPGLALGWIKGGGMALREEVGTDLRALCGGKTSAVEIANRWSRDDLETRLWFAAALMRDEAQAASRGQSGPLALTPRPDFTKLAAWFEQANRARAQLRGPLRPELVALEVLSAVAAQAAHAT
jgi:DNA polymerase-3 subunit delta'